jgi:hypothetical protein
MTSDELQRVKRLMSEASSEQYHPKAFVSHATLDHPFVEKFAADLRANGVDAWFSKWEIKPGDSIPAKIDEGLEDCEFFIIVLSQSSIDRPWVKTELAAATMRKQNGKVRKIIPIEIEDCGDLPPTLASLLWEDFSNQPYEVALKRVLDSIFEVDVRPPLGEGPVGTPPELSLALIDDVHPSGNESPDQSGELFLRPFLWNGHEFYRCSICEVDNQERTTVEEHTRLNHGFAVGEERTHGILNLLIANASGTPLRDCKLTVVDFRKWDQRLKQFHLVYEMRDFQPIGLRGNYSPIYVGKPAVFQFVDAEDPAAPIIRAVVGLPNSAKWVVPSPGIWKAAFEVQFGGKSPTRFCRCLEWDGRANPKFVLCP